MSIADLCAVVCVARLRILAIMPIFALLVSCGVGDRAADTSGICPVVDQNSQALFANADGHKVVVVGEVHGTNEAPALFLQLVCRSVAKSHVTVGVELPPDAVAAVSMASEVPLGALSEVPFWAESKDGRSSIASYDLVRKLKLLQERGLLKLIAFDLRTTGREDFGSLVAESAFSDIKPDLDHGRILILTGDFHASPSTGSSSVTRALVKKYGDVFVTSFTSRSGSAWNCMGTECAVHEVSERCGDLGPSRQVMGGLEVGDMCIEDFSPSRPLVDIQHQQ